MASINIVINIVFSNLQTFIYSIFTGIERVWGATTWPVRNSSQKYSESISIKLHMTFLWLACLVPAKWTVNANTILKLVEWTVFLSWWLVLYVLQVLIVINWSDWPASRDTGVSIRPIFSDWWRRTARGQLEEYVWIIRVQDYTSVIILSRNLLPRPPSNHVSNLTSTQRYEN